MNINKWIDRYLGWSAKNPRKSLAYEVVIIGIIIVAVYIYG